MKSVLICLCLIVLANASNKYAPKCTTDSDCKTYTSCEDKHCIHKGLIPLDGQEVGGTLCIFVLALLSNAAGIGGSTIMIALLLLVYHFETHSAIPLAQAIVWAGALISVTLRIPNRHPTRDRPLISWDLVMHLSSLLLLGTSIGVMLNVMFPEWLILALLTLLVIYLSYKILKRGIHAYKRETLMKRISIHPAPADTDTVEIDTIEMYVNNSRDLIEDVNDNRAHEPHNESKYVICEISEEPTNRVINEELRAIMQSEKSIVLWGPVTVTLLIFGWVVLASFIKGDKNVKSMVGLDFCSGGYWGFLVVFYLSLLVINILTGIYLLKRNQKLEKLKYNFDEHDLRWDLNKLVKFSLVSLFSGFLAGLLGIGSGLIVGPVMLSFGIRPDVSAANSSTVIVVSSSISMILYLMADMVELGYAGWFIAFVLVGAAIGLLVIRKIVVRKKRASILIILLGSILFISCIIIPIYGTLNVIEQNDKGDFQVGFKDYCV